MIEFRRSFDRFAASLVCCLSAASSHGKLADKRSVKTPLSGIRFSDPYYIFLVLFIRQHPIGVNATNQF